MKKIIAGIAVLFILLTAQATISNTIPGQLATVTYIGIRDNGLLFELQLNNEQTKAAYIIIKDKNGEVLYEENFRERKLVKRFLLPSDESGEFIFVVRNGSNNYEKRFSVNRKQTTTILVDECK